MIRWLDYNDCWLAAEWGHPSDNLGGILAVADWISRTNRAGGHIGTGTIVKIKDVLEAMIKAHEIQGCLALENSFNKVGLDHVVLVKVATAAVVSKMMGLSERQTADAISQAWVDGQSLRTYRHSPNTMSRKSWAAGDACQRAVSLVMKVQRGEQGVPTVLSAPVWGFYDVLFKGRKFEFQRPYGNYVMENVLFKVSYPGQWQVSRSALKCIFCFVLGFHFIRFHFLFQLVIEFLFVIESISVVKVYNEPEAGLAHGFCLVFSLDHMHKFCLLSNVHIILRLPLVLKFLSYSSSVS